MRMRKCASLAVSVSSAAATSGKPGCAAVRALVAAPLWSLASGSRMSPSISPRQAASGDTGTSTTSCSSRWVRAGAGASLVIPTVGRAGAAMAISRQGAGPPACQQQRGSTIHSPPCIVFARGLARWFDSMVAGRWHVYRGNPVGTGVGAVRRAVLFLHLAGTAGRRADLRLAHAADLSLCDPVHAVGRLLAAGPGAGGAPAAATGVAAGAAAQRGAGRPATVAVHVGAAQRARPGGIAGLLPAAAVHGAGGVPDLPRAAVAA